MIPHSAEGIRLAGKLLYERGHVSGTEGNISIKLPRQPSGFHLICTPTGVRLDSLTDRELSAMDDNTLLSGPPVTSEYQVHRLIHQHPHIGAVVHTHAPYSTALSLQTNENLAHLLMETEVLFSEVPRVPRIPAGTLELAEAATALVAPETRILILEHHGIVALGATLEEALNHAEMYENNAKIIVLARG